MHAGSSNKVTVGWDEVSSKNWGWMGLFKTCRCPLNHGLWSKSKLHKVIASCFQITHKLMMSKAWKATALAMSAIIARLQEHLDKKIAKLEDMKNDVQQHCNIVAGLEEEIIDLISDSGSTAQHRRQVETLSLQESIAQHKKQIDDIDTAIKECEQEIEELEQEKKYYEGKSECLARVGVRCFASNEFDLFNSSRRRAFREWSSLMFISPLSANHCLYLADASTFSCTLSTLLLSFS